MKVRSLASFFAVAAISSRAFATEICGNGIDDDTPPNGMTDEGCYPTLTTGVCESPLSCGDTGMVGWRTGSLHYDLPPDIAPNVPYGPKIGFRRYYLSQAVAGTNPTSVNKTPLGTRWGHTYLTYLYDPGSHGNIIVHNSQGRDVLYTWNAGLGYYTPQAGDHAMSLKYDSTNHWYLLQLLTGETLKYNSSGQLVEIWDNLTTPNKVLVTWDSTSSGNVSTVTDASGERRLLFSYTSSLLTSLQFQLNTGTSGSPTWTTQHTTSYEYNDGVTQDATSNWYVPANSTEWTNLLSGTGISNPSQLWLMQESSGNLSDSIGTATLTATGTVSYQQSVTGWSRKAVAPQAGGTNYFVDWNDSHLCQPGNSGGCTLLALVAITSTPTADRDVMLLGDGNGWLAEVHPSTNAYPKLFIDHSYNPTSATGSTAIDTNVHPWILYGDGGLTPTYNKLTDDLEIVTPTATRDVSNTPAVWFGAAINSAAPAQYLYGALWNSGLTPSQVSTLINLLKSGPTSGNLSSVTIGGQLAQKYTYTSNYLTKITDGANNQIAAFAYSSSTSGQVDLITTSRGTVGFDYAPSRTGCSTSGMTLLYFNQGNSTSCSVDSDCGTGYMCGGKTGGGSTGTCFLAGRCLTTSTASVETQITAISAIGPGGTCSGACADVIGYTWETPSSNNLNPDSIEDATTSGYTVFAYNTNGLPTSIKYGATSSSGTSPNRTLTITYDSTYPGRVATLTRTSDISPSNNAVTTYSYSGLDCSSVVNNQLDSIQQAGYTKFYDSSKNQISNTTYTNTTSYKYDCYGRTTEIDGPVSGMKSTYGFYAAYGGAGSTGSNTDNFVSSYKAYYDATHYLQPQVTTYDFWGHPTSVEAPDGNFTCDTYDSGRGYLASRRHAMAGQTSCTTTNSADLTTNFTRDSWLRLTQLQRPDGSCVIYSYDTSGRLYQTKRRDDCNASSSGDTQQWSYTADSLVSEVDTYDASNNLTAKQPYTYYAGRQLQHIVNPVNTSYFTGLVYDAAGKLTEVDGANSLSETAYHYDTSTGPGRDGRVTSEDHYKTNSTFDTWSLLYAWMGSQNQLTDGDSKVTGSTRDDLDRLVVLTSPDLGDPMLWQFDAAGRATDLYEDTTGTGQVHHTFTYDYLGRQTVADYSPRCTASGTNHAWITRNFDSLPSGVSCPSAMTNACTNITGRLAYVQAVLLCSSTYSDGSLDQQSYYAYDDAGRLIEEYITDDSGRTADHLFSYTKNGALSSVTMPSGAVLNWTYGSSGNNSDADLVTGTSRGSTNVTDTVKWFPFGPLKQYNQENSISSSAVQTTITRNLAYRISDIKQSAGTTTLLETAITEDLMGRVTSRVYTGGPSAMTSSYFLYDEQSRVTCETTDSQTTCPSSGTDIKNNHSLSPPFTNAGDWKYLLRPVPGSGGGLVNDIDSSGTKYNTAHQVNNVNQSDGTTVFGQTVMAYDARGNRTSDDNTSTLNHDERNYTYDSRRNVVNVRGEYYTGSAWHYYDVASAFDAKNRRVYKSFYDETTLKTATWYFYYDPMDRVTEVRYTPDTSSSGTYSVFQQFWIDNHIIAYWETDYPGPTTSKRYVGTDETGRPLDMWTWPSSGDATRVWTINPSAWGFDSNVIGPTVYQPILFAGQYEDNETAAYENDGLTIHRPGVALNGFRTYDPSVGQYLQLDPLVDQSRSSYVYVDSNPVGRDDSNQVNMSSITNQGVATPAGYYICDNSCSDSCFGDSCAQSCAFNVGKSPDSCSVLGRYYYSGWENCGGGCGNMPIPCDCWACNATSMAMCGAGTDGACFASCNGRQCGPNPGTGCSTSATPSCGTCTSGDVCNSAGQCVPTHHVLLPVAPPPPSQHHECYGSLLTIHGQEAACLQLPLPLTQ
jgi:RHS repeat-associated protein